MPKNIKTQKNKKSQNKKSQNKKFLKKKYKNSRKYINRFIGGALEPQPVFKKRIALFFDNEESNFSKLNIHKQNYTICPNVINIKVMDNERTSRSNPKLSEFLIYDKVIADVNKIMGNDIYNKFISKDPNKILYFDALSGIPTDQLISLTEFINTQYPLFITDIILDFDRTFTLCEGLFSSDKLSGIVNIMLNKNINAPEDINETKDFLDLLMGGIARRYAMKQLLLKCIEKYIKITILTNNKLPNKNPTLFPEIISLVMYDKSNENVSLIDIISTVKPANEKQAEVQVKKYTRMEELNICDKQTDSDEIETTISETIKSLIKVKPKLNII